MPKVAFAAAAYYFFADHAIGAILVDGNCTGADGLVEARPTGTGFKFRGGFEEGTVTAGTHVRSFIVGVPIFAGECPLRALFTQHMKLHRGQNLLPFLVGPA